MELGSALATDAPIFPSIRDAVPFDLGGIYARKGFAYQDEVAAGFYIEMLLNDALLEVCCETHDDIVVVRQRDAEQVAEFVQVKAEHPEQLWTASLLCAKPKGLGSSILEKSLARDRYAEVSTFRVVTCRQVRSELTILTWPRNHEDRSLVCPDFAALANDVCSKLVGVKSAKGCDSTNWLIQTKWDVISETEITPLNCQNLAVALHKMGHSFDPDAVRAIYEHLRALAKNTAEFGKEKWLEKPVSRVALLERLKEWINPYPDMGQVERLEAKLDVAGLDDVCKKAAVDQRRNYLKKKADSRLFVYGTSRRR